MRRCLRQKWPHHLSSGHLGNPSCENVIGESDRTTMGQGHTTSEVFGYLSGARAVHLPRVGYSLDLAWPSPALHHPSCAPCTPSLCANPFILLEIVRAAAIRRPKETHLGFPPPLSPSCCFHMSSCLSFCCSAFRSIVVSQQFPSLSLART